MEFRLDKCLKRWADDHQETPAEISVFFMVICECMPHQQRSPAIGAAVERTIRALPARIGRVVFAGCLDYSSNCNKCTVDSSQSTLH